MIHLPYVAILTAYVLAYLPRLLVVWPEMAKLDGGYDNRDPRGQQAQLTGVGKRALGAHHNGLETFAPFSVGVLAALGRDVRVEIVAYLAIGFVAARAFYVIAYLADKPSLRTALWALGTVATSALLLLAVTGSLRG